MSFGGYVQFYSVSVGDVVEKSKRMGDDRFEGYENVILGGIKYTVPIVASHNFYVGSNVAFVVNSNGNGPFTGWHNTEFCEDCVPEQKFMLIETMGVPAETSTPLNQSVKSRFTTAKQSQKVIGVLAPDVSGSHKCLSLGEGSMWVINEDGNIEAGDYLMSSSVPGFAMRQGNTQMNTYTAAKSYIDCRFEEDSFYKLRQISVSEHEYTAQDDKKLKEELFTICGDFITTAPHLVGKTLIGALIGVTQHTG